MAEVSIRFTDMARGVGIQRCLGIQRCRRTQARTYALHRDLGGLHPQVIKGVVVKVCAMDFASAQAQGANPSTPGMMPTARGAKHEVSSGVVCAGPGAQIRWKSHCARVRGVISKVGAASLGRGRVDKRGLGTKPETADSKAFLPTR